MDTQADCFTKGFTLHFSEHKDGKTVVTCTLPTMQHAEVTISDPVRGANDFWYFEPLLLEFEGIFDKQGR